MLSFILLLFVAAGSAGFAGYAYILDQRRRAMLDRALGAASVTVDRVPRARLLAARRSAMYGKLRTRLEALVPTGWVNDAETRERMIRAGHDHEGALFVYAVVRLSLLAGLPLLTLIVSAGDPLGEVMLYLFIALALAWLGPRGMLDSMVRKRQERIRRGIPDALDLMIVCVEAGSSLESAIMRVARDLAGIYPDLAGELATVLRKTKAGATRGEALRGLWTRTGVAELRTLAANIAQSERWGTSIGRVLRVTGETLRRKRRHSVEKRAAMATLKMTLPLVLMILPPLFLVILGPGLLSLIGTFTKQVK